MASTSSGEVTAIAHARLPWRPQENPLASVGARGLYQLNSISELEPGHSECILGLQTEFTAQDRPSEPNTVLHGIAADAGITLGETDLVGDVGTEQPELPPLAHFGYDACIEVVVAAQRIEARAVLVVLTNVLIGQELGHRTPAKVLRVTRGDAVLELRQAGELYAIDDAADQIAADVAVDVAAVVVLVVGILVIGIQGDLEFPGGRRITARQGIHATDHPQTNCSRAIGRDGPQRYMIDVLGLV